MIYLYSYVSIRNVHLASAGLSYRPQIAVSCKLTSPEVFIQEVARLPILRIAKRKHAHHIAIELLIVILYRTHAGQIFSHATSRHWPHVKRKAAVCLERGCPHSLWRTSRLPPACSSAVGQFSVFFSFRLSSLSIQSLLYTLLFTRSRIWWYTSKDYIIEDAVRVLHWDCL